MQTFSKRAALRFGWDAALRNIGFFVLALLAAWVTWLLLNGIGGYFQDSRAEVIAVIFSILSAIVALVAKIGFLKIGLKVAGGDVPVKEDFRLTTKEFWNYVGVSILSGIITVIGFVLLVIPGIMAMVALQFASFNVLYRGMGPVEAIRASFDQTKGNRWELFKFDIMCLLTLLVGAIVIGVGLFVAIPMVLVAQAFVYRHFTEPAPAVAAA